MSQTQKAAIEQTIRELENTTDPRVMLENQDKVLAELRAMLAE